jgi:8-oxo-dGTP pyrophosphatase MutT (NUDIX family)
MMHTAIDESVTDIRILRVERLELVFSPWPWPFATENDKAIERHFAELKRTKPAIWNGRTLLLGEHSIADGVFHGRYFETDYASFLAWRFWGFPDQSVKHCFALGALRGSDGGFLLGVMGAHTVNAGRIYFPAGLPDPSDVTGDTVDLAGNIRREVAEETGLTRDAYTAESGWYTILAGPRVAQIKILHADESAARLRERILDHLAREREPELAGIRIVRAPADFDPMMPPFVTAFLRHVWSRES